MNAPDDVPGFPASSRRWRIPPAVRSLREGLAGERILQEIPGDLGVLLWQSWRDVELWADADDPVGREKLFQPGALVRRMDFLKASQCPAELLSPVTTIATATRTESAAASDTLMTACLAIGEWAGSEGHAWVAVAFAQAGALAKPENAAAAYQVGRASRRAADYSKAESWYQRAIALARRSGDWESYALANAGIGVACFQRGAGPAARRALLRALRAARKYGLWEVRGVALHDLFCISANGGHFAEAERLARLAFRAYGKRHPRVPALAHDVVKMWVSQGFFERAIPVLRALVAHTTDRPLRLLYLSSLARAAASAGERMTYVECWIEAFGLMQTHRNMEYAADSLINLAHGAATLGDPERVEIAAQYALAVALARREAHARLAAEQILESLIEAKIAEVADPVPTDAHGLDSDELSKRFVAALATPAAGH